MAKLIEVALEAAQRGGAETLKYYSLGLSVEQKPDGSPVTRADQAAHKEILEALSSTGLTIVSEEGAALFLDAKEYWLVDPLDGTKDFLEQNNEFTVNVALIQDGYPTLGVVHAPALKKTYLGVRDQGAWVIQNNQWNKLVETRRAPELRLATSRFHDHAGIDLFSAELGITQKRPIGSALKYCLLASSEVDVFPRLAGCSEWDTGAGQAVLEAVGGTVLDWATKTRLKYGKARRRNPPLISFRAPYVIQDFHSSEVEGLI